MGVTVVYDLQSWAPPPSLSIRKVALPESQSTHFQRRQRPARAKTPGPAPATYYDLLAEWILLHSRAPEEAIRAFQAEMQPRHAQNGGFLHIMDVVPCQFWKLPLPRDAKHENSEIREFSELASSVEATNWF